MNSFFINYLKKYDFSFFSTMLAIFVIGIINLYSATHADSSEIVKNLYKSQLVWFSITFIISFLVSLFIGPKTFFKFSYFIYGFGIFLLILVDVMGHQGMGAQRWLTLFGSLRIQPSEIMKLGLVMALARYYSQTKPDQEMGLKELIIPGIITLVPTALIIIQPDLGTGLLLILIFLFMSFYRRLRFKTIAKIGVMGAIFAVVMYNFGLKEYQRKRILNFINPYEDAKGTGYNAIQSQIAIGSGRILGKGFKNSSQASLSYLPENHTDFIFSIYNEEHGFLGSLVLISLFVVLLMRFIWLSKSVLNFYDSILSIGILAIFFWHIFINMGMVMGLLPIVGIPLPLMSYGGSSLMTFGLLIGMATSLSNSRNFF